MNKIILSMLIICLPVLNCATMGQKSGSPDIADAECLAGDLICYNNKAVKFISEEKYEAAIGELQKAIEIDKNYIDAMMNLGLANRKLGNYDKALEWYGKILIISPVNIDALKNSAIVYRELDKKNEAVNYLEKAAGTNTDDPDIYYLLGEIYYSDKSYTVSFPFLEKAYHLYSGENNERMYDAALMMADCLSVFTDWTNTVKFVKIARNKYPDNKKLNTIEKMANEELSIRSEEKYADILKAADLIMRNPASLLSSEYYSEIYAFVANADKRYIDGFRYNLRWIDDVKNIKWQHYLLGSYIAGDLKMQVSGQHEMTFAVSAMVSLLNTYLYIKAADNNIQIPELEEFEALYNADNPFFPFLVCIQTRHGWASTRENQAFIFHQIRKDLGDEFEKELVKFAGKDLHRIYDCGIYLTTDTYLFGEKPFNSLALRLFETGMSRKLDPQTEDHDEMYLVSTQVSIKIQAVILYAKSGKVEKARKLKKEIEKLVKDYPVLSGSFPAFDDEERNIYEKL